MQRRHQHLTAEQLREAIHEVLCRPPAMPGEPSFYTPWQQATRDIEEKLDLLLEAFLRA